MRFIIVCTLFALCLPATAADNNKVDQAIDFLKTACASGEKVEIKAEGDGGLSLTKRGAQGRVYFSKVDARGVAEGLSGEVQGKNLNGVRECMKPYITKILDAILSERSTEPGDSKQREVTLNVFNSFPNTCTGITARLLIDGKSAGTIDNLDGARRIHIGQLLVGSHSFELADVEAYCIDFYRTAHPQNIMDKACSGDFYVSNDRAFKLYAVYLNGVTTCRFD